MDTREREKISKKIIHDIIEDLADRSGIGNEWEVMDEETQEELVKKWESIVKRYIPIEKK
jgi:hypothetical protein